MFYTSIPSNSTWIPINVSQAQPTFQPVMIANTVQSTPVISGPILYKISPQIIRQEDVKIPVTYQARVSSTHPINTIQIIPTQKATIIQNNSQPCQNPLIFTRGDFRVTQKISSTTSQSDLNSLDPCSSCQPSMAFQPFKRQQQSLNQMDQSHQTQQLNKAEEFQILEDLVKIPIYNSSQRTKPIFSQSGQRQQLGNQKIGNINRTESFSNLNNYVNQNNLSSLYHYEEESKADQNYLQQDKLYEEDISQLLENRKKSVLSSLVCFENNSQIVLWSRVKHLGSKSIRGSKYRGVSKNGKKWQVQLLGNLRKRYIGSINSEAIAGRIYDHYAIITHGLKAKTNFSYSKGELLDIVTKFSEDDLINPSHHIVKSNNYQMQLM